MGFDSKCNFALPIISLGRLLCPWMWGIFFSVGSSILLLIAVLQRAVILEFLQKMSTCPFTLPSWSELGVVDVTGDGSKVQCSKEQYCIETWNVRSMNQGKLEVVKLDMARVNIDILGISKLKCTRMGEFNSDDHYIYYCG